MFEETNSTLLCSDLFHQNGDLTHLTDVDILEGHKKSMLELEKSPLMDYVPYNIGKLFSLANSLNGRPAMA